MLTMDVHSTTNPRVVNSMLICSDGTVHYLTNAEKLWLMLGLTNLNQLDKKYNRQPQKA